MAAVAAAQPDELRINQLQFVGSHNSYKLWMSDEDEAALRARNPEAADSLDYGHIPLARQLTLGLRKLELDVFWDPDAGNFPVGHVQVIDMNTLCTPLRTCLEALKAWSDDNPTHVPVWVSFNAKDQPIEGLPDPAPFTAAAFAALDEVLRDVLGDRLIEPAKVKPGPGAPVWPPLAQARGSFLLILDEVGAKREVYAASWRERAMFVNVEPTHPAAAVMIVNDPVKDGARIAQLVRDGYMVRTRADADTREARANDTGRRDAAFASGAQAVSTDYYLPAWHFGNTYQVPPRLTCNPVNAPADCSVAE